MRFRVVRFASSLVFVIAACTDLPNEPATSASPPSATGSAASMQGGTGKTSLDLVEDDYSAGALDKQNANIYREAALSDPSKLPAKYRSSAKGKDATYSLVQMAREWSSLSKSTQQQILDLRAKGLGNLSQTLETQHFVSTTRRSGTTPYRRSTPTATAFPTSSTSRHRASRLSGRVKWSSFDTQLRSARQRRSSTCTTRTSRRTTARRTRRT
jgi:hypothetical protein